MTLEQFEIDGMNGNMREKYGREAGALSAAIVAQVRGEAREAYANLQGSSLFSRLYRKLVGNK